MRMKLLIISLSYIALFGSAEAINFKALSLYGDFISGDVFRGQPVSQAQIKAYVESLDASPEDMPQVSQNFVCNESDMKRLFKNESGQVQDETIGNFLSYFQQAKPEEQYALSLLVNKIMEQLR